MASRSMLTPSTLANHIIERFVRTGEDSTVAELATRLNVGQGTIRKLIEDGRGFTHYEIASHVESRPSYSRDYPSMQTGRYHQVRVYGPTRAALASRIRQARENTTQQENSHESRPSAESSQSPA